MNENEKKLIIEAYIVYLLSFDYGEISDGASIYEIREMIEKLDGYQSSDDAINKRINRYIDDLIEVGFLDKKTRRKIISEKDINKKTINRYSIIPSKYYRNKLVAYHYLSTDNLKTLYRVIKILNSRCGDSIDNRTFEKFKTYYFSNGLELNHETLFEMYQALGIINSMFNHYETDDVTTINRNQKRQEDYSKIFMRLKREYAYNPK